MVEKSKNKKLDGAKRKLQEECGIYMYSKILNNTRLLKSEFVGDPSILEVHVFTTDQFTGTVHESSEMKP